MESIYIKNFGPIDEVDIADIRKVTIFIGESGSGKSTIMKVVSLFRWLYKMLNIRSFLKYSGVRKSPFRFSFLNMLNHSGMLGYLKSDTVIIYVNGSCRLEWIPKSKKLSGTSAFIPKEELSLEKISYISDKRNLIPDLIDNNVTVKRNMFYVSDTLADFETAVRKVGEIEVLDLGVRFKTRKTSQGLKYMIVQDANHDDTGIKLQEASSGTQNVVPMNVIVEYYSQYYDLVSSINNAVLSYVSKSDSLSDFKAVKNIGDFANKNVHLVIEEPELSLFPSSQKTLTDFLVKNIYGNGDREYSMTLMMATHSPYIVNYLNVLLRKERLQEPGITALKARDLSVFRVYGGRVQNLMAEDADNGESVVDTSDLSAEMEDIFNEYMALGEK